MKTFLEIISKEVWASYELGTAVMALKQAEKKLSDVQSTPRKKISDERVKALRQRMAKIESDIKTAENRYNDANDLRIRMETKSWNLEFNQIIRDLEP